MKDVKKVGIVLRGEPNKRCKGAIETKTNLKENKEHVPPAFSIFENKE